MPVAGLANDEVGKQRRQEWRTEIYGIPNPDFPRVFMVEEAVLNESQANGLSGALCETLENSHGVVDREVGRQHDPEREEKAQNARPEEDRNSPPRVE